MTLYGEALRQRICGQCLERVMLTSRIDDEVVAHLYTATRDQMQQRVARLRRGAAGRFPEKGTAFRAQMAVHGRFRLPGPDCGTPVPRIRYADIEANYCPRCQTGGKRLVDRAFSRLLKQDWLKSVAGFDRESKPSA